MKDPVILASASPRRRRLLETIGLALDVRPMSVDESRRPGETPSSMVRRLARDKASAAADLEAPPESPILAADTAVVFNNEALGKPADEQDARTMLMRLRGRWHEVLTGLWLRQDEAEAGLVASTRVRFRDFDAAWLDWYVESDEPFDKAGAYGIQGRGALLVDRIEGSWSNVVGLPLERLPELFERVGLDLRRFTGR